MFGRSGKKDRPAAERWAGVVQRHPVLATVASAAFILILAAPALAMKLSMPDESAQARGTMGCYMPIISAAPSSIRWVAKSFT